MNVSMELCMLCYVDRIVRTRSFIHTKFNDEIEVIQIFLMFLNENIEIAMIRFLNIQYFQC